MVYIRKTKAQLERENKKLDRKIKYIQIRNVVICVLFTILLISLAGVLYYGGNSANYNWTPTNCTVTDLYYDNHKDCNENKICYKMMITVVYNTTEGSNTARNVCESMECKYHSFQEFLAFNTKYRVGNTVTCYTSQQYNKV